MDFGVPRWPPEYICEREQTEPNVQAQETNKVGDSQLTEGPLYFSVGDASTVQLWFMS